MAANRTESPAAEPASGSAEATASAPASPPGGGFKAWLPLLLTLLFMPVLAFAMTSFVLVPRLQKSLGLTAAAGGSTEAGSRKIAASAKKESYTMNKLLVNVAGTMGQRYLLVSVSIVGTDPDLKQKIQDAEPQLRDMACGALSAKTLADLEKPGARNLIRTELISGFNDILGSPVVKEMYLTEFAIQ